jgi:hypothetical protein
MAEFRVESGGPFKTAVGEFSLIVSTYATVTLTKMTGGADYLGQSTRPQTPGMAGGTNDVVLKFKSHQRGEVHVGLQISGMSYETRMEVPEENMDVKIIVA